MSYYMRREGESNVRPVAGTVRHAYDEARWACTDPGDKERGNGLLYAEQFFDGRTWRPIAEYPEKPTWR